MANGFSNIEVTCDLHKHSINGRVGPTSGRECEIRRLRDKLEVRNLWQ